MPELTGRIRFAHLYRRAGFGATPAQIDAAIALHADENTAFNLAVDQLVNYAATDTFVDRLDPIAANSLTTLIQWWMERLTRTSRPLLERMVLFWHDHFATAFGKDGITISSMKNQNELFRTMAMGSFELLNRAISQDPAMIFWLDLNTNRKSNPNENYARELQELFMLGVGPADGSNPNYTENDIKEVTKVFTGYTVSNNAFTLNQSNHSTVVKTVRGVTIGPVGSGATLIEPAGTPGDAVIGLLLTAQKNGRSICARYIAAKIFSYFAYPVSPDNAADDAVVNQFADIFSGAGYAVGPLVSAILKSNEFSSNLAYRALVRSPVELAVAAFRQLNTERVPASGSNNVLSNLQAAGQQLFVPPDVSGWPYGRLWVNDTTMLQRCNGNAKIINSTGNAAATEAGGAQTVPQLLASLVPASPTGAQRVDAVLSLLLDGPSSVPSTTRDALITYANGISTTNQTTADQQVRGLFNMIMALPAYQLA
ncbi:MAG: DUF1800 domain-containing protein [Chloroflexota bacterium]